MELTLTTPALLFPAISLLLLAYTNRFLHLAQLTRNLHSQYRNNPEKILYLQLLNLRKRINIIRNMQVLGSAGFLCSVICMFFLFRNWLIAAKLAFTASLGLLIISLALSVWELYISVHAIDFQLHDLEKTIEEHEQSKK
jgi:hypothetical protein